MPKPTAIQTGDTFKFEGIGSPIAPDSEEYRIITVLGCSVTGELSVRIDMPNTDIALSPRAHGVAYSEALLMIEQGIWRAYNA